MPTTAQQVAPFLRSGRAVDRQVGTGVRLAKQDAADRLVLALAGDPPCSCSAVASIAVACLTDRGKPAGGPRAGVQRLSRHELRRLRQFTLCPIDALADIRAHGPAETDTVSDALLPRTERLAIDLAVGTVGEPVEERVLPLGVCDHVAGRVREERLVELGEERLCACRVWGVAELPVDACSDPVRGSLHECPEDRHDDHKGNGRQAPAATS